MELLWLRVSEKQLFINRNYYNSGQVCVYEFFADICKEQCKPVIVGCLLGERNDKLNKLMRSVNGPSKHHYN